MAEHAPTADSVAPADDALNRLSARFGDALQRDTRPGYEGLIAGPEQLVAVATALRDELGYDYLASATGRRLPRQGRPPGNGLITSAG